MKKTYGLCSITGVIFLMLFSSGCKEKLSIPTVLTEPVTNIKFNEATSGGTITDDGNADVVDRGVCWSVNPSPTINDSKTHDGSGLGFFASTISELEPNTKYYVRAYALNSEGTGYGEEVSFTTETITSYRLTSEKYYGNGEPGSEIIYTYSDNKISKWSYSDVAEGINYSYPDNNTIRWTAYGLDEEFQYTGIYKLSQNRVIEITIDGYEKVGYSYNSEGNLISIKRYDYPWSAGYYWDEETFTYDASGKLIQIFQTDDEDDTDRRSQFSYNGEEIKEIISSYRVSGGSWVDSGKDEYIYSNGKISRINFYSKSGSTWILEDNHMEFFYDINGNLSEKIEYYQSYIEQVKYTYELGSGNFLQLFTFFETGDVEIDWTFNNALLSYPMPTK